GRRPPDVGPRPRPLAPRPGSSASPDSVGRPAWERPSTSGRALARRAGAPGGTVPGSSRHSLQEYQIALSEGEMGDWSPAGIGQERLHDRLTELIRPER